MRRIALHAGFVLYAFLLASFQSLHHVRTDEAKYLLSIPYPHPPLVRSLFHALDGFLFQEFFLRFLLALLFVYAALLAVRLIGDRKPGVQIGIALCWLGSLALLLHAGSIMMASVTALQAWVFVYLLLRDDDAESAGIIGLWWLISLFTAYQIVLFTPVVWMLLFRKRTSTVRSLIAFGGPLALLALYTVQNPLVIGSLLLHGDQSATLLGRLHDVSFLWLISGSFVVSIAGLYGMIRYRQWAMLLSLILVTAYVSIASFGYYAPLFLPLSLAGVIALVRHRELSPIIIAGITIFLSVVTLILLPPDYQPSPARRVMRHLVYREYIHSPVMIYGDFGHEWQYESRLPIVRYTPGLLPEAWVVICTVACPAIDATPGWSQVMTEAPFVYIRRP